MKLSFNLVFQTAGFILQGANAAGAFVPPKYQFIVAGVVGACQLLISWRAQWFNPDGTPAAKPFTG